MTWWAFDAECHNWDRLVVAIALADDGRVVRMYKPNDIADWYVSLDPADLVWAHNGGGYDFILLIDACRDLSWSARMGGSAIISCRADGYAECRDSMRLFMSSLDKWTDRKDAFPLDCIRADDCEPDCAGYCAMGDLDACQLKAVEDYCIQDCRALLDTLCSDIERLDADGLDVYDRRGLPRLTLGAVAWATAARMAGIERPRPIEPADYAAERRYYYGGRVEVGRVSASSGHAHDVHSMYPAMLRLGVPVGSRRALIGVSAARAYRAGRPGGYVATLDVPDTDIPLAPHRYIGDTAGRLTRGRLVWATGRIVGSWALPELQAAVRHGARIVSIASADVYPRTEALYGPYVEHVYDVRREALDRGDKRWGSIVKWFANSLTGKLAQRPGTVSIRVVSDDEPEPDGYSLVAGRVWSRDEHRIPPNARPIQAAYLTAHARVTLLDRLVRNAGRWLYCDTDSTYLLDYDPTDEDPSALGMWGYDGPIEEWTALAPKLYGYVRDGRYYVRAKGVPKATHDDLLALQRGETIEKRRGVERLKTGGGRFVARTIKRSWIDGQQDTGRCGTRYVQDDDTTRPLRRTVAGVYV